jgi:N6-adenosine-specific RNA methylase IME4
VPGTGYWLIDNLETYLIATRGRFVAPAPGQQWLALIKERRGKHSEKPAFLQQKLEELFPNVPKLEMFARKPRDGWDVWGNEVT